MSEVDTVVEAVRKDLLDRSQVGIAKYGTTLDRSDLSLRDWLQHAYEETLDQANYLKRAIMDLDKEVPPYRAAKSLFNLDVQMDGGTPTKHCWGKLTPSIRAKYIKRVMHVYAMKAGFRDRRRD